MAAYFPRDQQPFTQIRAKVESDFAGVATNRADALVFVTNQEIRRSERRQLQETVAGRIELYHLERVNTILSQPSMARLRRQYLGIDSDHREAALEAVTSFGARTRLAAQRKRHPTVTGRDLELAALAAATPGLTLIEGPSWSGKTALLTEFCHRHPSTVVHFFDLGCTTLSECADVLASQLALGGPAPSGSDPVEGLRRLSAFVATADASPPIVVVDAIDEADEPRRVLEALAQMARQGLVVVASINPRASIPTEEIADTSMRLEPLAISSANERDARRYVRDVTQASDLTLSAFAVLSVALGPITRSDVAAALGVTVGAVNAALDKHRRHLIDDADGIQLAHRTLSRWLADSPEVSTTKATAALEAWADEWSERGWPADTPAYLLSYWPRHLGHDGWQQARLLTDSRFAKCFRARSGPRRVREAYLAAVVALDPRSASKPSDWLGLASDLLFAALIICRSYTATISSELIAALNASGHHQEAFELATVSGNLLLLQTFALGSPPLFSHTAVRCLQEYAEQGSPRRVHDLNLVFARTYPDVAIEMMRLTSRPTRSHYGMLQDCVETLAREEWIQDAQIIALAGGLPRWRVLAGIASVRDDAIPAAVQAALTESGGDFDVTLGADLAVRCARVGRMHDCRRLLELVEGAAFDPAWARLPIIVALAAEHGEHLSEALEAIGAGRPISTDLLLTLYRARPETRDAVLAHASKEPLFATSGQESAIFEAVAAAESPRVALELVDRSINSDAAKLGIVRAAVAADDYALAEEVTATIERSAIHVLALAELLPVRESASNEILERVTDAAEVLSAAPFATAKLAALAVSRGTRSADEMVAVTDRFASRPLREELAALCCVREPDRVEEVAARLGLLSSEASEGPLESEDTYVSSVSVFGRSEPATTEPLTVRAHLTGCAAQADALDVCWTLIETARSRQERFQALVALVEGQPTQLEPALRYLQCLGQQPGRGEIEVELVLAAMRGLPLAEAVQRVTGVSPQSLHDAVATLLLARVADELGRDAAEQLASSCTTAFGRFSALGVLADRVDRSFADAAVERFRALPEADRCLLLQLSPTLPDYLIESLEATAMDLDCAAKLVPAVTKLPVTAQLRSHALDVVLTEPDVIRRAHQLAALSRWSGTVLPDAVAALNEAIDAATPADNARAVDVTTLCQLADDGLMLARLDPELFDSARRFAENVSKTLRGTVLVPPLLNHIDLLADISLEEALAAVNREQMSHTAAVRLLLWAKDGGSAEVLDIATKIDDDFAAASGLWAAAGDEAELRHAAWERARTIRSHDSRTNALLAMASPDEFAEVCCEAAQYEVAALMRNEWTADRRDDQAAAQPPIALIERAGWT